MFQSVMFSDELEASAFEARMHGLLCAGRPDEAAHEVQALLDRLDGGTHPIAALCRKALPDSVAMTGWAGFDYLPVNASAVGFDLSWPGHFSWGSAPAHGLDPVVETNYYSDGAGGVAFSTADHATLAAHCGRYSAPWQGEFDDIRSEFAITGLADLNGAVWNLARPRADEEDSLAPSDCDACHLGQIYLAVALYRAVDNAVRRHGLPRPLAVLIGSNEASPHFNAPVIEFSASRAFVRTSGSSTHSRSNGPDGQDGHAARDRVGAGGPSSSASASAEPIDNAQGFREFARAADGIRDAVRGITKDKEALRFLGALGLAATLAILKKRN